jgi:hypothetical protein
MKRRSRVCLAVLRIWKIGLGCHCRSGPSQEGLFFGKSELGRAVENRHPTTTTYAETEHPFLEIRCRGRSSDSAPAYQEDAITFSGCVEAVNAIG